jgi:hypothetical protein
MEPRRLGASGFTVPVLSLGTGSFGGGTEFFKAWGNTDAAGATHQVQEETADRCVQKLRLIKLHSDAFCVLIFEANTFRN